MNTPTFGIFDHIEGIPGTSTQQLFRDRLDLVRMADQAGFTGFYLAEHHGTDLCMAPNQDLVIAAASQITTTIRMGPMVKLLPLHRWDAEVLGAEGAEAALGPLRRIMAHIDAAIEAGHGSPSKIVDRFGQIMDDGMVDHIVLQTPTGDITMDEAKSTLDLFCSEVQPILEAA